VVADHRDDREAAQRVEVADAACMRAAGPPQGSNCAPAGGSEAAKPRAWEII
jgi:hypothetical protein